MNCNELKDDALNSIVNADVWDDISSDFGLTSEMLDRYADKLNWRNVSQNSEIHWTVKLLEKWADRLDWDVLSECRNEYLLTPNVIAHFIHRWNWHKLSDNASLKLDLPFVDKFVDHWDWSELIGIYPSYDKDNSFLGREFFERYRKYIPINAFLNNSQLYRNLKNEAVESVKKELTEQC